MQVRAVAYALQQIEQLGDVVITATGNNCSVYFPDLVNALDDDVIVSMGKAYLVS